MGARPMRLFCRGEFYRLFLFLESARFHGSFELLDMRVIISDCVDSRSLRDRAEAKSLSSQASSLSHMTPPDSHTSSPTKYRITSYIIPPNAYPGKPSSSPSSSSPSPYSTSPANSPPSSFPSSTSGQAVEEKNPKRTNWD